MKESYGEDVASHTGPESCVDGRKAGGEALTGVRMGWVLSRESILNRGADAFPSVEGNIGGVAIAMMPPSPARSQTPRTCGNSMHRSWEIPCLARADGVLVRVVNPPRARRR
jgi:hypothetical protein